MLQQNRFMRCLVLASGLISFGCREQTLNPLDKQAIEALAQDGRQYKLDNHGRVIELLFDNQRLDDKILEEIRKLKELRVLNLCGTNLNDEGLAKLADLKHLQYLRIDETAITDKGLTHLEHLQNLSLLAVKKCKAITGERVAELERVLPGLKVYR